MKLELKNITKKFDDNYLYQNVSYSFPSKGLVFVTGHSGSGKSTLLNIIAGFVKPDSGKVFYNDKCVNEYNNKEKQLYLKNNISFVFQNYNLISSLSVFENLKLSISEKRSENEILNVLSDLNLSNLKKRKVKELSGGQSQRVAIARALLRDFDVLLCDEPTGALDHKNSIIVFDLLKKISKDKLVIVVSHDTTLVEQYSDVILDLNNGFTVIKTNEICDVKSVVASNNNLCRFRIFDYFKMIFSYMFKRKINFLFSIFLISISLLILSVFSAFKTYDVKTAALDNMYQDGIKFVDIKQNFNFENQNSKKSINKSGSNFNLDFVNKLEKSNVKYSMLYDICDFDKNIGMDYKLYYSGFVLYDEDFFDECKIIGNKPAKENEVLLSKAVFEYLKTTGFINSNNENITINNVDDLLNQEFVIHINLELRYKYKIVGIIDTNLKENLFNSRNEIHTAIFVYKDMYNKIKEYGDNTCIIDLKLNDYNEHISSIDNFQISHNTINDYFKLGNQGQNEIILNAKHLKQFNVYNSLSDYMLEYAKEHFNKIEEEFKKDFGPNSTYSDYYNYLKSNGEDNKYIIKSNKEFIKESFYNWCNNNQPYLKDISLDALYEFNKETKVEIPFTVIGLYYDESHINYCSKETYDYVRKITYNNNETNISNIMLKLSENNYANTKVLKEYKFNERLNDLRKPNSYTISFSNEYLSQCEKLKLEIETMNGFYVMVGISSLVLGVSFLISYVYTIINDRKKDILILKTLGFKQNIIWNIFISIGLIIIMIISAITFSFYDLLFSLVNKIIFFDTKTVIDFIVLPSFIQYLLVLTLLLVVVYSIIVIALSAVNKKGINKGEVL